ncbi:MAG: hypothetical protein IPJ32_14010 [Sphingobacteriaceae bacterium]|nr:hypothetical protein [Sphingobacteriaceae bacterium]
MQNCRIIFLLLSSLLLASCVQRKLFSYEPKEGIKVSTVDLKPVIPESGAVKYKASIDFLNKHFTGLIVLKQTDAETKHLVFVTELGMRMLDFEIKGDSMKPVFVFDPLNKPKLVSALISNFSSILLIKWFNKSALVRVKSGKEVLNLKTYEHHNAFLFRDENKCCIKHQVFYKYKKESKTIYTNNYNNIKLKQYGLVKLYIELEKIND